MGEGSQTRCRGTASGTTARGRTSHGTDSGSRLAWLTENGPTSGVSDEGRILACFRTTVAEISVRRCTTETALLVVNFELVELVVLLKLDQDVLLRPAETTNSRKATEHTQQQQPQQQQQQQQQQEGITACSDLCVFAIPFFRAPFPCLKVDTLFSE